MLAAALALGGSLMAMSWGHWYLTNSGLPKEPLEQMSLLLVAALALQAVLLIVGLVARCAVPLGDAALGCAGCAVAAGGVGAVRRCALTARVSGGEHPRDDVGDRAALHRRRRRATSSAGARPAVCDGSPSASVSPSGHLAGVLGTIGPPPPTPARLPVEAS
jgi:hypothetical protein